MPLPPPPGIPTSTLVLFLETVQTSPTEYVAMANLGDFTGPQGTSTIVDVSKHGDTFRRKVKTLMDAGILAFPVWFDPSQPTHAGNQQAMAELYQTSGSLGAGALQRWLIAFVDENGDIIPPSSSNLGPQMVFNAYVSKFSMKEPVAGVYSADAELTIDGKPIYLWETTTMPAGQVLPGNQP